MNSIFNFLATTSCLKGNGTSSTGLISSGNLPTTCADNTTIANILEIIFVVMGALALLMIVIAGFRYMINADNSEKAAEAKRSIIYSLVGLIMAAMAAIIVSFVNNRISG